MQLNSDALPLAVELRDPEIRQHTIESQIKIGIPFQIRAMREHRGWTQEKLAEKIGTTQNTISRLENPKTGKPTITTLLRIANACDVGLLVRFVPFGFYGDVINAMDETHVEVPSYDEELKDQESGHDEALAAHAAAPASLDWNSDDYYANSIPGTPATPAMWNRFAGVLNYYQGSGLHIDNWFRTVPQGGMSNSLQETIRAEYPSNLVPGDVFLKHQEKSTVRRYMGKADSNIPKEALRYARR
jgi:transcriptional regulator with XRE-family HTH domain